MKTAAMRGAAIAAVVAVIALFTQASRAGSRFRAGKSLAMDRRQQQERPARGCREGASGCPRHGLMLHRDPFGIGRHPDLSIPKTQRQRSRSAWRVNTSGAATAARFSRWYGVRSYDHLHGTPHAVGTRRHATSRRGWDTLTATSTEVARNSQRSMPRRRRRADGCRRLHRHRVRSRPARRAGPETA
jgi:hypothetical protein